MRWILLLFCCYFFIGCGVEKSRKPVKPYIAVAKYESSENGYSIKISYNYHYHQGRLAYFELTFNNLEDLQNYKKQLEFALRELEIAEDRMKTLEMFSSVWVCDNHGHTAKTEAEMRSFTEQHQCKGWHKIEK